MHFTRILLSVAFVLFASTALAAKPEKALVCHVGNEEGPGGETYLADPGCVPIVENGYFCPDAGKIDLIEVAKAHKHLNNPSHAYDGISDYLPGDIGANGEGNEDSSGNGIDDGCEPPAQAVCPCWTAAELSEVAPLRTLCNFYTEYVSIGETYQEGEANEFARADITSGPGGPMNCTIRGPEGAPYQKVFTSADETVACFADIIAECEVRELD